MSPYICQRCSHDLATTHITIVSMGMVAEFHVCIRCEKLETQAGLKRCPSCGSTFPDIQARGRFGCAMDYDVFASEIEGALASYHGAIRHVGKFPK